MNENASRFSGLIIGAAIEVHRHLGPGLLESVYRDCLCEELTLRGTLFQREVLLPVVYKGKKLRCSYRLDLVVSDVVLVELKAVEKLLPIYEAQVLTYLRLTGLRIGLLINFNVVALRRGIKRLIWGDGVDIKG